METDTAAEENPEPVPKCPKTASAGVDHWIRVGTDVALEEELRWQDLLIVGVSFRGTRAGFRVKDRICVVNCVVVHTDGDLLTELLKAKERLRTPRIIVDAQCVYV